MNFAAATFPTFQIKGSELESNLLLKYTRTRYTLRNGLKVTIPQSVDWITTLPDGQ